MTARFQGPQIDPVTGCLRFSIQNTAVRPADAIDFRGMAVAPDGAVYVIADTGQPRVFQDGIAIDPDTGLTIVGDGPVVNISMGGLGVNAAGAVVSNSPPDLIHQGVAITNLGELCAGLSPILRAFASDTSGVFKGLQIGAGSMTFARVGATATVADFEGLVRPTLANELRVKNARRVHNLATGLVTETITVVNGSEYQLTIRGASGATAVCSGSFTGTLTADGTNRISWPSGTPKTSNFSFLTITVTGTLTEMLLEDVTSQANQNPSENVPITGATTNYSYADGVRYFAYENGTTVDISGVVTGGQGAALSNCSFLGEPAATNLLERSEDFSAGTTVRSNAITVIADQAAAPSSENTADELVPTTANQAHWWARQFTAVVGTYYVHSVYVKPNGYTHVQLTGSAGFDGQWQNFILTGAGSKGNGSTGSFVTSIEACGNGFYRITYAALCITDVGPIARVIFSVLNADTPSRLPVYAGDGTSGVYGWGFSCEVDRLTSYMKTGIESTTTRSVDDLTPFADLTGNVDETEGMLVFDLEASTSSADLPATTAIVSLADAVNNLFRLASASPQLNSFDGVNTASRVLAFAADNLYRFAVRWNAGDSEFQVGYRDIAGAGSWQWGTVALFDGAFAVGTAINIFYGGPSSPLLIKNMRIYDSDEGEQWLRFNF